MDSREELLRQQLVPPDGYDYEEDLSCGISSSCDWQSECSGEEVSSRCLESVSVGETDGAISRRWPTTSATGARVLRACDCIRVGVIVGIDSEPEKGVALAKEFASRGIMHIGIVGLDQRIVSKCASDIESGAHAPLIISRSIEISDPVLFSSTMTSMMEDFQAAASNASKLAARLETVMFTGWRLPCQDTRAAPLLEVASWRLMKGFLYTNLGFLNTVRWATSIFCSNPILSGRHEAIRGLIIVSDGDNFHHHHHHPHHHMGTYHSSSADVSRAALRNLQLFVEREITPLGVRIIHEASDPVHSELFGDYMQTSGAEAAGGAPGPDQSLQAAQKMTHAVDDSLHIAMYNELNQRSWFTESVSVGRESVCDIPCQS